MKRIAIAVALLAVLALVVVGCTSEENSMMKEDSMMEETFDDTMMVEEDVMMESDEMMEEEDVMMKEDSMMEDENMMTSDEMMLENVLAGESSSLYLEFNKKSYEKALADNKVILLDFYAKWCPTCKKEQPEIIAAFNKLDKENIVGFRVNYKDGDTDDYEVALAKEFGIAYQHTKVIIVNGERVLKSPESWDEERYVTELSKY